MVDKRGCGVATREACAVLWEDRAYNASRRSYFQNIVADLRAALTAAGAEAVLVRSRNSLAIDRRSSTATATASSRATLLQ